MSPVGIGALVIFAIGMAVATSQLPLFWRNDDPRRPLAEPQPWWPYGRSQWLRFLRCYPLAIVGAWVLVLIGAILVAAPELFRPPLDEAIVAAFAVLVVLGFTAYVFGWPAVIVPPWLRGGERRQT